MTEAGELLAGYAARILGLWQEAGEEMATLQGVFAGSLRVGAVTTAEYLLPPLLVTFANANPKVKVKLQVGNRDTIVRMLAGQEIDLAIMGRPPAELKTHAFPFAKHPMAFVAAPNHPLMHGGPPGIERLAEARILVRERGSGTRTTVERLFKDANLPMRIGSELSSNEAIKQMCAAGFWRGLPVAAYLRARNERRLAFPAHDQQQPDRSGLVCDASCLPTTVAGGWRVRTLSAN